MIGENKCGGGIDLFITYVCREKKMKRKKKEEKNVVYRKKKKKKWINVPFPNDLGGRFEVKVYKEIFDLCPLSYLFRMNLGSNMKIFGLFYTITWMLY